MTKRTNCFEGGVFHPRGRVGRPDSGLSQGVVRHAYGRGQLLNISSIGTGRCSR